MRDFKFRRHLAREQLHDLGAQPLLRLCIFSVSLGSRGIAQDFPHLALQAAAILGSALLEAAFDAFFEVADDELDTFIPWLLDSAEGMAEAERVARRGRNVVETELTPARAGRFMLSFLADLEACTAGIP